MPEASAKISDIGLASGGAMIARFARLIAATGPISVAQFMAEAHAHYYASRDPLGVTGDFITAPEISQMFGEMIGIWLADVWQRAGAPDRVLWVEPGAGRGTLARDALRVMARFGLVPQVHFIEPSPVLRAAQAQAVPQATWHDDLAGVPDDRPLLFVANEWLDVLPVRQLVRSAAGWRERLVDWDAQAARLRPVAGGRAVDALVPPDFAVAEEGAIVETCPAAQAVMAEVATRVAQQGGVALIIDYGRNHGDAPLGSTLQAVAGHARVDPFRTAGDADLTALVDFTALAPVVASAGARWLGLADQGPWLQALGIAARAQALAAAQPHRADEIAAALVRLTDPLAMGSRFKVLGLAAPEWPGGAGFG